MYFVLINVREKLKDNQEETQTTLGTRNRTKTNKTKRHKQHWATRNRTKTNKTKRNKQHWPQETERRQTKQRDTNKIGHKKQNDDKQNK